MELIFFIKLFTLATVANGRYCTILFSNTNVNRCAWHNTYIIKNSVTDALIVRFWISFCLRVYVTVASAYIPLSWLNER